VNKQYLSRKHDDINGKIDGRISRQFYHELYIF